MENIEAMLCAYIEGDLDEAGRAQIEKHLRENPQHRKMIDELMATREMVKALPRVKAPVDVGDMLRGQVERSILLDDSAVDRPQLTHADRWPQIFAVAAIFLLSASLCLILYRAIGPTFRSPDYTRSTAIKPMMSSPMDDEADKPAQQPATLPSEAVASNQTATTTNELADGKQPAVASAAVLQNQMQVSSLQMTSVDIQSVRGRLQNSGFDFNAARLARGQAAGQKDAPMLLVVSSANPSAAKAQLTQFLSSNSNVSWKMVPADVISPEGMIDRDNASPRMGLTDSDKMQMGAPANSVAQAPSTQPNAGGGLESVQKIEHRAGTLAESTSASDIFVANGITQQQAEALRQTLSSEVNTQVVQPVIAGTQPSAAVEASAGGVESVKLSEDLAAASPTTQETQTRMLALHQAVPTTRPDLDSANSAISALPQTSPGISVVTPTTAPSLKSEITGGAPSIAPNNSSLVGSDLNVPGVVGYKDVEAVIVVQASVMPTVPIPPAGSTSLKSPAATQPGALAGEQVPATEPSSATQP